MRLGYTLGTSKKHSHDTPLILITDYHAPNSNLKKIEPEKTTTTVAP